MASNIFSGIIAAVNRKNKALKKYGGGKAGKRIAASPDTSKGKLKTPSVTKPKPKAPVGGPINKPRWPF